MKGFDRKNHLFSLCGLNCGLCPMFLGRYCGGCGNGNQSCKIAKCSLEQQEKIQILSYLLDHYNDGRRKNFFCVAVNLLELSELQEIMTHIQQNEELPVLSVKEQCFYIVDLFQKIADRRNIKLKLVKK